MSANTSKQFIGFVIGKKTAGTGSPAIGTYVYIPITGSRPRDPENNTYAMGPNKTAFPSLKTYGKRTPSLEFSTLIKPSWASSVLFTSLIASFDANNDVDTWAWLLNDGTAAATWSNRVFDGCKGVGLKIAQSAQGGGIGLNFACVAQSAQGVTSFSTATYVTDAGNTYDVSNIDYGGNFTIGGLAGSGTTADLVRGYSASVLRGGSYDFFFNGTLYPAATSSGMMGGMFQLEQSPLYSVSPGTSAIIRIGASSGGVVTPAITATIKTSHDEDVLDLDAGFGDIFRGFTMIDTSAGGQNITFS
jgi:hypothetical protein